MIYIQTIAYNAAETLPRAVESVINQTYGRFRYYICDNGSDDGGKTRKIIQNFARLDKRIVPSFNEKNHIWDNNMDCWNLPRNIGEEDYFCTLDADDAYKPTFLEETLAFINQNGLDIAVCGSDFINAQNNRYCGVRILQNNMILESKDFASFFPVYHQFMRTVWGKLFKGKAAYNVIYDRSDPNASFLVYGSDTYCMINAFQTSRKVGILAKSLHKYYVSKKSSSYTWNKKRIKADQILHKVTLEFLAPYGPVSPENEDFLFAVYMNALKDTWNVLHNAKIANSEKVKGLYQMYLSPYTRQLAAKSDFGVHIGQEAELQKTRGEFFASVVDWLLAVKNISSEQADQYCDMGDFFCAALEFSDGWIWFQKLRIGFLTEQKRVEEAAQKLEELKQLIPEDRDILKFERELETGLNPRLRKK